MTSALDTRLIGAPRTRLWQELFGNSLHFPLAIILLEMFLAGPGVYFRSFDAYIILSTGVIQAIWLARHQITSHPSRLLGNLIGPALYTLIEAGIEGRDFFTGPHHLAYWSFALTLGSLQAIRPRLSGLMHDASVVCEHVVRAGILLAMYGIFEQLVSATATTAAPQAFLADRSHQFVALAIPLLGLSLGLANLTAARYLAQLQLTSGQLRTYAEWLLGRALLDRIVADPAALTLTRQERTVMFMDIRGFTRWSEQQTPEVVAAMLNRYYLATETIVLRHDVIKFKFAADEAMAVFTTADHAAATALDLRCQIADLLAEQRLGVGIGMHTGLLVEGLLGGAGVKFYDVIGDSVNTAKRIESATAAGEVLISIAVAAALTRAPLLGEARQIAAKGKGELLTVLPLEQIAR